MPARWRSKVLERCLVSSLSGRSPGSATGREIFPAPGGAWSLGERAIARRAVSGGCSTGALPREGRAPGGGRLRARPFLGGGGRGQTRLFRHGHAHGGSRAGRLETSLLSDRRGQVSRERRAAIRSRPGASARSREAGERL